MMRPPDPRLPKAEDRTLRLFSLRQTPPGCVRTAVCLNCRHMAPLPVRDLVGVTRRSVQNRTPTGRDAARLLAHKAEQGL